MQTVTLKYKDGEKKIIVTPETAIVTYVPGDKPGPAISDRAESARHSARSVTRGRARPPH
jgi:hypothetical protein